MKKFRVDVRAPHSQQKYVVLPGNLYECFAVAERLKNQCEELNAVSHKLNKRKNRKLQ